MLGKWRNGSRGVALSSLLGQVLAKTDPHAFSLTTGLPFPGFSSF